VIIGVAVAVVCGTLVALSLHVSLLRTARAEAARLTQITATVVEPAAPEHSRPAVGHWTTPDGARHIGVIPAPPERGTGAGHPVWVDDTGQIGDPPKGPVERGVLSALAGTMVALAIILLTSYRPRDDDIDTAWRQLARHWTRRYL
jgi:hypothetical protein